MSKHRSFTDQFKVKVAVRRQNVSAAGPNQKRAGDIFFIWTDEGRL